MTMYWRNTHVPQRADHRAPGVPDARGLVGYPRTTLGNLKALAAGMPFVEGSVLT